MAGEEPSKQTIGELLWAFGLPAAFFLLLLIRYRVVPFGGKTLLCSDLDTQYIEFMAEYRRMLLGKGSFFYSWHAGLGMNFTALIAYYLASPFNLLLPLFPENQLPLAVSVITTLKLGCAGAAFAYFLRKRFGRGSRLIPLFSAFYALNAWVLAYSFNIMWLDSMIWLPLLCAGIESLLEGRWKGMAISVPLFALSFLSQFYMAYMTGAFCVLYFLSRLFVRKTAVRACLTRALRFFICVMTAAGLSAFLLLPTFFVLKNNMGLLGQQFPAAAGNYFFFDIIRKLFIGSFDGIKDSLPHIYCGLPALIGTLLFFSSGKISAREKTASGLIIGSLLLSFWFAPLNFIWHAMDHPSWFPYRYAFLFTFFVLVCAYEGFTASSDGKCPLWTWILCGLMLLYAVFGSGDPDIRYAVLNAVFLAAYAALLGFVRHPERRFAVFAILCGAELLVNGSLTIKAFAPGYTTQEAYQSFHEQYRGSAEKAAPAKDDFYRMEKTAFRNYNDAIGIGLPGMSHFSSTASTRQSEYLKRLGFNCYATWCTYQGSTGATDAMLRIRYEFGPQGKADSVRTDTDIWEHPAQFPLFFFAPDAYARYDFFSDSVNKVMRQNDLLKLLDGRSGDDYYRELPVQVIRAENLAPEPGGNYRRIDPALPAYLDIQVRPEPGRSAFLSVPGAGLKYNIFVEESQQVFYASRDYTSFLICLDPYVNGGKADVRIETTADSLNEGITAYTLDTDRLPALADRLSAAAPVMTKTSETSFLLRCPAADTERLIVSSIPFDAGWRVKAGGQTLPLKMIHDSILGFVLPAGCDEISVSYRPYGWETGLGISIFALLLWAGILFYEKRKNGALKK